MEKAHTATSSELKSAIAASGATITLPTMLSSDMQDKIDDLTKADAKDFDKKYADDMVDAHQAALNLLQRYAQDGDVAQIKDFAAKTSPAVQEHLTKAKGIKVTKGLFPWTASGRAIANGRDEGFTKLIFDEASHRIIGGGIVGTHAGDMIGEIALAIEMGADAVDIGKTIHPHPTLGESLGMAAEVAHGSCTDVPPVRKK